VFLLCARRCPQHASQSVRRVCRRALTAHRPTLLQLISPGDLDRYSRAVGSAVLHAVRAAGANASRVDGTKDGLDLPLAGCRALLQADRASPLPINALVTQTFLCRKSSVVVLAWR
jgi:hypothetical protein